MDLRVRVTPGRTSAKWRNSKGKKEKKRKELLRLNRLKRKQLEERQKEWLDIENSWRRPKESSQKQKEILQTPLETLQKAKKVAVDLAEQVRRSQERVTCKDRVHRLDHKESTINHSTRAETMKILVTVLKRIEVFPQGEEEVDLGLE